MKCWRLRGAAILLEVLIGLSIILVVVLVVATMFPSSYQGSLQGARMSNAVSLGRQVLERQKAIWPVSAIGNQTVDREFLIQGRPATCQFFYRLDLDSAINERPQLWKVTVQWEHTGKVKEIVLVGSVPRR